MLSRSHRSRTWHYEGGIELPEARGILKKDTGIAATRLIEGSPHP